MATPQTNEALRLLIAERDRIDRAIALLPGEAQAPRRGRPPGKASRKKTAKRKGRPPMSEAEKQAASERMRKYWAKRRREAKKAKKAAKESV